MKSKLGQRILHDNSLTLVLALLFVASLVGHALTGHAAENQERLREGTAAVSLVDYLASGGFLSSVFENWESEFLQMWAYVMLTAYLFQRGSPESRDPDENEPQREGEGDERKKSLLAIVYAHSLGLALLTLFIGAFVLHWINSMRDAAEEAVERGQAGPDLLGHLGSAQLWFESFQNWQSEFLSTAVLVLLGIFLRERLSPESKAVGASNAQTGSE